MNDEGHREREKMERLRKGCWRGEEEVREHIMQREYNERGERALTE